MDRDRPLSDEEVAVARQRRLEATKLQEIEGNPLTAEEVAMFEMFERERWSHERRRAHIMARAHKLAAE
jgi:Fic family protein